MLKRIKKIHKFGIFDQFTAPAGLSDFTRFNLIYGWNGSGKTTLSKLFSCLSTRTMEPLFEDCDFDIELVDGSVVKRAVIHNFGTRTIVFNQTFIEDNIDWKRQGAKSLIVIAEEKIEERNRFFEIKDRLIPGKETLLNAAQKTLKSSEKERDDFLTMQARAVKNAFQLIDTSDTRYLNYDRAKIRAFIQEQAELLKHKKGILRLPELEQLRKRAQPIEKPLIAASFPVVPVDAFKSAEERIRGMLDAQVVSVAIDRLKQHEDINEWVRHGLSIHDHHGFERCEFCGEPISVDRILQLRKHFSTAYVELLEKLNAASRWLHEQNFSPVLPDLAAFYEEFHAEFQQLLTRHAEAKNSVDTLINEWTNALAIKKSNVFETDISIPEPVSDGLLVLAEIQKGIQELIKHHNRKTDAFEQELTEVKTKLEMHYVAEGVITKDYFALIERIGREETAFNNLSKVVQALVTEKQKLEASLANAAKGADEFNTRLKMFLGRHEIELRYDANEKGYRIVRSASGKPAVHLSEAEKTAIAFVYFSIKLTENGNRVEDSIIVVDDPISSFDANHLFHSFAFLKKHCENALQLFMLTHNFQYFKMLREWIMKKNKKDRKVASVYAIELSYTPLRHAYLADAHASLLDYGSEYHFLFRHLYAFKDITMLDTEKAYQVANYSRKMLEAFFHFKYPKARDNFYQLMCEACKEAGIPTEATEKVYRFINNYSHHSVIEFDGSSIDNQLAESENVTKEVLHIMERSDANHYKELVEVCRN